MKKFLSASASFLGLLALIAGVWGANSYFAQQHTKTAASLTTSSKPATAHLVARRDVNMATVPAEKPGGAASRATGLPALEGNQQAYDKNKKAAAHSTAVPKSSHNYQLPANNAQPDTPNLAAKIQGQSDSAATCPYFGGCQPPDMALAASAGFIMQGVNTSFAVYTKAGIQPGWPKNAQNFFGVPNPGACDPNGPFLSDPRAFFDFEDDRFWVTELQVEGAFGLNACPEQTLYWVGVSASFNPNGVWHIYAFDMSLGTTNAADYTQIGFDAQAFSFSANMFDQTGSFYEYAEAFSATKKTMESGAGVSAFGAFGFNLGGTILDTVQPVEDVWATGSPFKSSLFIGSENIAFGGGQCFLGCSGVVVWANANPGTPSSSFTGTFINTVGYALAPAADDPGCTGCIETLDTRITGTPVYHAGLISFALETGINNGTQVVPGILWGQVGVTLDSNGVTTGGFVFQQGYFNFGSDNAASFGALMPDNDNDLVMVFELMGGTINPKVAYVSRRATFALGSFHDLGNTLQAGAAPTFDSRWGDYEATSYDHPTKNDIWIAGQYSNASGDWSTTIGEVTFKVTDP